MNDSPEMSRMGKIRGLLRRRRFWVALVGLFLLGEALFTQINFNKPLEAYAKPEMTGDELYTALERGDYARGFPSIAQLAIEGEPWAMFIAGEYFRRGLLPVHRDFCSALDAYYAAGVKGDVSAQERLAEMLLDGHGGYQDAGTAYMWAAHAAARGDLNAKALIDADFKRILSDQQMNALNELLPRWSPERSRPEKAYRMPIVPIFTKLLKAFLPIRYCGNPTLFQHLFNITPPVDPVDAMKQELRRRERWGDQR